MPAVALGAATWGLVHRVRPLAWAAAAIAMVTARASRSSTTRRSRPASPSSAATTSLGLERVADRGARALACAGRRRAAAQCSSGRPPRATPWRCRIRQDDVSYPFFGADLDRRVVFVEDTGGLDEEADWLVVAPGLTADVCDEGWRSLPVDEPDWRLYERVGLCPGETAER